MDGGSRVLDDYMELILQFGFIVLFSSVFPLAAALSFLTNTIQMKSQINNFQYTKRYKAEVSDGIGTFVLSDQSTVYAIKESTNLLGISTTKVGLGSTGSFVGLGSTAIQLAFTVAGLGVTHSFKRETSPITADANVHEATLTTEEAHGLTFNDPIRLVASPNKEQIVFVQYNDYNRRIVFDRKKFEPSGITSTTNSINVQDHNLVSGDKVIYSTGGTAPSGMADQEIYYAIRIDSNNLKLAANKVDALGSNPTPISIGGTGSGEHFLSKINPRVDVRRGNTVSFATTDSSLSIACLSDFFASFSTIMLTLISVLSCFFLVYFLNKRPSLTSDL